MAIVQILFLGFKIQGLENEILPNWFEWDVMVDFTTLILTDFCLISSFASILIISQILSCVNDDVANDSFFDWLFY